MLISFLLSLVMIGAKAFAVLFVGGIIKDDIKDLIAEYFQQKMVMIDELSKEGKQNPTIN